MIGADVERDFDPERSRPLVWEAHLSVDSEDVFADLVFELVELQLAHRSGR